MNSCSLGLNKMEDRKAWLRPAGSAKYTLICWAFFI
jgi:hypothetical protein